MLSKEDITYNIPSTVQSLYNRYIKLAQFQLNYTFLLLVNYNDIQNLINQFNTHDNVLLMKKEYNAKVLNYKNALKNLNGTLYTDIPEIREINIDNISGLWMLHNSENANTNIMQYFLPINNKLIDSHNLFFDVDKNKTEEINQLGFLNKFQYDILHSKDSNRYLNFLKVFFNINPIQLCRNYLLEQLLKSIKDLSYNNIDIIKKYWLLSEFTEDDLLKINSIFANNLLNAI